MDPFAWVQSQFRTNPVLKFAADWFLPGGVAGAQKIAAESHRTLVAVHGVPVAPAGGPMPNGLLKFAKAGISQYIKSRASTALAKRAAPELGHLIEMAPKRSIASKLLRYGGVAAGGAALAGGAAELMGGEEHHRRRRINPMNARAARRAIQRLKGVRKLLQRIERGMPHRKCTRPHAGGYRRRKPC